MIRIYIIVSHKHSLRRYDSFTEFNRQSPGGATIVRAAVSGS